MLYNFGMARFKEQIPSTLERETSIAFVGFTIFDILHILTAIISMVFAYNCNPILEMEAASSSVELCLSFLLIIFILSMVKRIKDASKLRRNFGFCALLTSLAVFLPISFMVPEIIAGDWGRQEEVPLLFLAGVNFVISLASMILFALAQLHEDRDPARWRKIMFAGNAVFMLQVPLAIVAVFLGNPEFPVWFKIVSAIGKIAPLFPGALIFWRLSQDAKNTPLY